MSNDESSGGKRLKYQLVQPQQPQSDQTKDEISSLVNLVHTTMPSQKRGAGQPLCTSATEMTSKKARKMSFRNKKDLSKLQSMKYEFGDDDPHMAKAAVYYLLLLEDQLVSKVSSN